MADLKIARIGTSGYSFLDWIGPFYPETVQKGKMLDYYVNYFDVVEINSSYYRIPHPKVFENIEKKTPPNFEFIVKGHQNLTHVREGVAKTVDEFKRSIGPLVDAGKLRGILLQFPYSFRWGPKNLSHLRRLARVLDDYPLYVEFRHRGWIRDESLALLRKAGVSVCSVDEPQIDALLRPELHSTSSSLYVRLHGRNAKQWWTGGALRYDYLYSEDQLRDWLTRIRECRTAAQSIYIFFNNCHRGQAVQNARMMKELIEAEPAREDTES